METPDSSCSDLAPRTIQEASPPRSRLSKSSLITRIPILPYLTSFIFLVTFQSFLLLLSAIFHHSSPYSRESRARLGEIARMNLPIGTWWIAYETYLRLTGTVGKGGREDFDWKWEGKVLRGARRVAAVWCLVSGTFLLFDNAQSIIQRLQSNDGASSNSFEDRNLQAAILSKVSVVIFKLKLLAETIVLNFTSRM